MTDLEFYGQHATTEEKLRYFQTLSESYKTLWEDEAKKIEILEFKLKDITESYLLEQEENIRLVERKDTLEEWLTDYRDQLKKENVYHKNTGIINAINELLDETKE